MHLISLTANQESFRSVQFKKGVNLILGRVGKQTAPNVKKTYNGVGKTLVLRLVHFCLGSNAIPVFQERLPGWDFTLKFEIGGKTYSATRSTQSQNTIQLDDETLPYAEFNRRLQELLFPGLTDIKYLTFRGLFPHFARLSKDGYTSWNKTGGEGKDYQVLLSNAYLLGLDPGLVQQKYDIRQDQDRISKGKQNLEKDPVLKKFFSREDDLAFELADLQEKEAHLAADLRNFQVAENYDQIKRQADEMSFRLKDLRNEREIVTRNIRNIQKSLNRQPDISADEVVSVYDKASKALGDLVSRRLQDVQQFHNDLLQSRTLRLRAELTRLELQKETVDQQVESLNGELDRYLKYLGSHGALDDFVALNEQLGDLRKQIDKLNSFKQLRTEYQTEASRLKAKLAESDVVAQTHLTENAPAIERNLTLFRSLSKEFYDDKPGGIDISVNTGENQIRFDLKVKIQDDASDGINEVKIFCYDFTILAAKHFHKCQFLFHDSRLFSNMDPRQRSTLFRLATKETESSQLQYIASVNQDQVEALKDYYSAEDYASIIESNKILELTDDAESSKLLGIQVDLNFDDE